jgi:hypothetical protein
MCYGFAKQKLLHLKDGLPFEARCKKFRDLFPVNNGPPCFDIVGSFILVVKIVGVFPHIKPK